ncbi:MscL family protein [Echinicola soli]|uniref:MscL family protein n=1 Tax=Echinicola soli TaxID=2591634 RepID=A0A514CLZ1_9BACT|nr:MscL family protein [Echinicola soli]QDH80842.1 MscL family protein [Echinicola soli]
MDNGTLIYIILTIVFFVIQALTKKKKDKGQEDFDLPEGEEAPRKQVSFDELLKEIRQNQHERQADLEKSGQKQFEKVPEPPKTTNEVLEEIPDKERPKPETQYYEGTYQADHTTYGEKLVKLDDQVDLEANEKLLKEVEDVAEENAGTNRYRRILKDPQTLKDAVVVSEILNRKYF